jgi:hypothetical protein
VSCVNPKVPVFAVLCIKLCFGSESFICGGVVPQFKVMIPDYVRVALNCFENFDLSLEVNVSGRIAFKLVVQQIQLSHKFLLWNRRASVCNGGAKPSRLQFLSHDRHFSSLSLRWKPSDHFIAKFGFEIDGYADEFGILRAMSVKSSHYIVLSEGGKGRSNLVCHSPFGLVMHSAFNKRA